jgi:hypothetical protein
MKKAGLGERDLQTMHERPVLLQELAWRRPNLVGPDASDWDTVATISFSFIDDQLFGMAVDYDRSRTEGLTANDMIAVLSAKYGPRSTARLPTAISSASVSIDAPAPVAQWQAGDTTLTLNHFAYSGRFALTIVSVRLQALARKAQAAAVAIDAREAPARDAQRERARVEAERVAAEKMRTTNKATFEP